MLQYTLPLMRGDSAIHHTHMLRYYYCKVLEHVALAKNSNTLSTMFYMHDTLVFLAQMTLIKLIECVNVFAAV